MIKAFFRKYILPHLTFLILRILWRSWRIDLVEPPELKAMLKEKKPFLLAHFHGDEIVLLPLVKRYRLATITSTSKDGELMTWIVSKLGGVSSRGSSTRGGVSALKGLIRLIKQKGYNSSVAVDGPKGPLHKVKPGIFELSRLSKAPIFWAGVSANRSYVFQRAWNKAILPLPFSHVKIEWFGPMAPIEDDQDPRSTSLSLHLEQNLIQAKEIVSKSIKI